MLDQMYKEYPKGTAPQAMEDLAGEIRAVDAFVFVIGAYNWGPEPGLKNLTDHFLEDWFWRPAGVVSYSPSRLSGVRASSAWHPILAEIGMVVVSGTVAVGPITETFDEQGQPIGGAGRLTRQAFGRFADDLAWWTAAARNQRQLQAPPY